MNKPRKPSDNVIAQISTHVSYKRSTGTFWWRNPTAQMRAKRRTGRIYGYENRPGEGKMTLEMSDTETGQAYVIFLHHIAYFFDRGHWPEVPITFKNGDPGDLHPSNIVEGDYLISAINRKLNRNSPTGSRGVNRSRDKWSAHICKDYRRWWLGSYNTREEAEAARNAGAMILYGLVRPAEIKRKT